MYIQITTRCNMFCEHCCMDATAAGEDMNIETFKKALVYDEYVAIGGGEPTLHPKFWEFIGLALGFGEHVWLATNGSQTQTSLALARMAKRGVIGCALSQDAYHDVIDYEVVQAFTKDKDKSYTRNWDNSISNDNREIRDVTAKEINGGRCDFGREDDCVCPGLICEPNGNIRACGCDDSPNLGDINTDNINLDDWDIMDCYKNQSITILETLNI